MTVPPQEKTVWVPLIPEAADEEVIGELQALFGRHNAGAAPSAKAVFKPTKEFHIARHALYSAEEDVEIDKVVPGPGVREDEAWEGRDGGGVSFPYGTPP